MNTSPPTENDIFAQRAMDYVTHICDTYGPRISCSPEEHAASQDVDFELQKICDETYLDTFPAYPTFYPQGFIKICGIFVVVGFPFMFLIKPFSIIATLMPILGLFAVWASFFLMKEWFAIPFKRGTSINATGRIFPRINGEIVEPKKRVVICGHVDSAFEMPITKHGDKIFKVAIPGFLYLVLQIIFGIVKLIILQYGDPKILWQTSIITIIPLDIVFLIVAIFGIPALISLIKGLTGGNPVMGANDNLSGVALALAIGQYFTKPENQLKNIELWVGSFGSEECGERGANAFVKKYGAMGYLDNSYNIVPDSSGAGERLTIITKEKVHYATHSPEVYDRMLAGYKAYVDEQQDPDPIPCNIEELPFAASDAGRFSLAGYKAASLIAFEGSLSKPKYWHSYEDRAENLELKPMRASFGLLKHFILSLEQELNSQ